MRWKVRKSGKFWWIENYPSLITLTFTSQSMAFRYALMRLEDYMLDEEMPEYG